MKNDPTYHIDEQTLELFVLGAPEVDAQKEQIVEHLNTCAVCHAIVEDFESLYSNAAKELQEIEQRPESSSKALIPTASSVEPFFEKIEFQHGLRPVVGLSRLKRFVYARPIASTMGGVGLLAACIAGLIMFINYRNIDNNPAFVKFDQKEETAKVYNKDQQLLWQIPLSNPSIDWNYGIFPALVSDLDGDGINEVVVSGVPPEKEGLGIGTLKVYNKDRSLRFERSFSEKLQYGPYSYDEKLLTGFVLSAKSGNIHESDVWLNCHFTRSPSSIERIDCRGNVVGEYWHYGFFMAGYMTRVEGIDHEALVLLGSNDVSDTINANNDDDPVIAVIDPLKIHGRTESSATRGFGMERSAAELYYIKLPVSDMVRAMGVPSRMIRMVSESDSVVQFAMGAEWRSTPKIYNALPSFDYVFNRRMEPVAVRSIDGNQEIHEALKKDKKISSVLDQHYLDDLKKRILYWNGKEWQSEVTRVK